MTILSNRLPMHVRIGSNIAPFTTAKAVSLAYRKLVKHYGLTSTQAPKCTIHTSNGECVGHVSYNGRVWNGENWASNSKPVYCPSIEPILTASS